MRRIKLVLGTSLVLICLVLLANKALFVLPDKDFNSSNLLRLHVIGNSNSLTDQLLKRRVREAVLTVGSDLFTGVTDIRQAKSQIVAHKKELEKIAQQEVKQAGQDYEVDLEFGEFSFPKRSYGQVTLAAGNYQALQVTLGQGAGENWWCVLFPPLCFIDSADQLPSQKSGQSKDEIEKGKLEVDFRFKVAEYLDDNYEFVKDNLNLGNIISDTN
ncbi:stage II sporulation protein R [Halanaerobaculum tunisiense]